MGFLDKLFGKKDKPPDQPPESHTLTDFIRGIQHAVNGTSQVLERHFIELFERYFFEDTIHVPDGKGGTREVKKFYPKMVTFKVKGDELNVPLISLIRPEGLSLSKMQVKMAMRVDKAQMKKAGPKEHADKHELTRSSFQVSMAPLKAAKGESRDMNAMEVTMDFVAGDAPEGVARIFDTYTNSIVPNVKTGTGDGGPEEPPEPVAQPAQE